MNPSLGLQAASVLVNFLLKTTAEWLVCLLLVWVAGSARTRFNLWLTMLLGFVAQWVWMWAGIVRAAFPSRTILQAAGPWMLGTGHSARVTVVASWEGTLAQAMAVLLVGYLCVLMWRMIGTVLARVRLMRAMRHKSVPGQMLASSFQEALEQTVEAGYKLRECELWVLPGVSSPATLGWWKPRVIVPPACETQEVEELKAVFWHELMHVERRDALWNALVRACRNVLWFHPSVHHAVHALKSQRELACDAAVVREHPDSRDVYATCLVRFARARDLAAEPSVAGIEMASNTALLTTRVSYILSEAQSASRVVKTLRATVSVLLVATMAATVPALNVLFAAEQLRTEVRLPVRGDAQSPGRSRVVKSASSRNGKAALALAGGSGETAEVEALPMPHDEGLAAEHRAAMDVLTESTGMGTTGSDQVHSVAGLGRAPAAHGAGGPSQTSWASVAVEAAERMGPLMSDHDSDDHH